MGLGGLLKPNTGTGSTKYKQYSIRGCLVWESALVDSRSMRMRWGLTRSFFRSAERTIAGSRGRRNGLCLRYRVGVVRWTAARNVQDGSRNPLASWRAPLSRGSWHCSQSWVWLAMFRALAEASCARLFGISHVRSLSREPYTLAEHWRC